MKHHQITRVPFAELSLFEVDPSMASFLPQDFCLEKNVVLLDKPSSELDKPIRVGMLNGRDLPLVSELEDKLDRKIQQVQLNSFEIKKALSQIYQIHPPEDDLTEVVLSCETKTDFSEERNPNLILQDILSSGLQRRATDIHLENYGHDVDLRFRVDGILYQITTALTPENINKVISCLKLMCEVDHLEKRRSQDGRFSAIYDEEGERRKIDFRVSISPCSNGQEAVIRILDPSRFILDLDRLGMSPSILGSYKKFIHYPNGLILATGPTGSGKTSTLYASINTLVGSQLKIMTAEDPVEYEFGKVNQKSVNEFMSFADHIRSFLRQDPDVIMVGEIRDPETAEIAMRASTTGHLILSTLHTRDAVGTIARLRNLGVPDDYISTNLIGVLGQRLIRRICDSCKEHYQPNPELLRLFYPESELQGKNFYQAKGCDDCKGRGYSGMIGVYEILFPDISFSRAIGKGAPVVELEKIAADGGFRPLVEDALAKAEGGLTSIEEVSRVIEPKFPHAILN